MKRTHRDTRRRHDNEPASTMHEAAPSGNDAASAAPPAGVLGTAAAETETALQRLHAQVAELSEELRLLRAQVGALYELERFRDVVLERHPSHPIPPPPTRRLEARDFIESADGFHNLEYDEHGTAYRWTGPGHFTRARFQIDRSVAVMVVLRLSSLGRHTAPDRITVDVDGTVYPMRQLGGEGIALVAGPVPPRAGGGLTDLFFHIPVMFTPRDSGIDDARMLGVAVLSIEVTPDA
jgi:uncharacterized coiled-coil protein SlyX